jgi:hypothetical protein
MNKVPKLDPTRIFPDSEHEYLHIMTQLNPGMACSIFASIFTLLWVYRSTCKLYFLDKALGSVILKNVKKIEDLEINIQETY